MALVCGGSRQNSMRCNPFSQWQPRLRVAPAASGRGVRRPQSSLSSFISAPRRTPPAYSRLLNLLLGLSCGYRDSFSFLLRSLTVHQIQFVRSSVDNSNSRKIVCTCAWLVLCFTRVLLPSTSWDGGELTDRLRRRRQQQQHLLWDSVVAAGRPVYHIAPPAHTWRNTDMYVIQLHVCVFPMHGSFSAVQCCTAPAVASLSPAGCCWSITGRHGDLPSCMTAVPLLPPLPSRRASETRDRNVNMDIKNILYLLKHQYGYSYSYPTNVVLKWIYPDLIFINFFYPIPHSYSTISKLSISLSIKNKVPCETV